LLLARRGAQLGLIGFCVLLVAAMWTGLFLQLHFERQAIIEAAQQGNRNLTRVFEEHVERTLRAVDITLRDIQAEYLRSGRNFDLIRYARERHTSLDPYYSLAVVDRNGDLVLANYPIRGRQNFRDRENYGFHASHRGNELFISKPRLGTSAATKGQWALFLSRRINGPDGSFGGYVTVAMDAFYFASLYAQLELGKGSLVVLIGNDGVIRARQSGSDQSAGQDVSANATYRRYIQHATEGTFVARSALDSHERLYSFRRLKDYPLTVVVARSEAAVLAQHETRKAAYVGWSGGVTIVIALFAALLVAQMAKREKAQHSLREAQQIARVGNWEHDLVKGDLHWSDAIYRIFEIDPGRFGASYRVFLKTVHPDDRELVNRTYAESVAYRTSYSIVYRLRMSDGRIKHVQERGQTFYAQDGRPLRSVGTVQDITALHEAEEALRKLNAELEARVADRTTKLQQTNRELRESLDELQHARTRMVQSEKMAALGSLVAGVAHEINTPVGIGITAASHLHTKVRELSERYSANALTRGDMERFVATAAEATEMVLANLYRAAELIRSFKEIAVDQSSGERRVFRLKRYLEEVLLSLSPRLKKTGHEIRLDCPEDLEIDSFPGAFSQIVANLVMNSLVHGFEEKERGRIDIAVQSDADRLVLTYRDDGKGIDPENLDRIFDPFFTTRRGRGGSGLGMHIVYNLVTQTLDGAIRCESRVGHGIAFELVVPVARDTDRGVTETQSLS